MPNNPKLIYKSLESNRPAVFPAFFYGMPDNHVYVVYSKPYKTPAGKVKLEYAVAILEGFSYDYDEEILIEHLKYENKPLYLESFVDRYDQKMKVLKVFKKIKNIFKSDLLVESLLIECINPVTQVTVPG